jgi:hypothetical protein
MGVALAGAGVYSLLALFFPVPFADELRALWIPAERPDVPFRYRFGGAIVVLLTLLIGALLVCGGLVRVVASWPGDKE